MDKVHESDPQTDMDVDDDNDGVDDHDTSTDSDVYDDNDTVADIDTDTNDAKDKDNQGKNDTSQPAAKTPVPEVVPYKPILDTGWLGPYPLDDFFSQFLPPAPSPCPTVSKDHFNTMPANVSSKRDMYKPFVRVNCYHLLPSLMFSSDPACEERRRNWTAVSASWAESSRQVQHTLSKKFDQTYIRSCCVQEECKHVRDFHSVRWHRTRIGVQKG